MIRRLAWAALSFSAAVFLAHFLVPAQYRLLCGILCAGLSLTALLFRGKNRRRVLLLCLFLALGFVRYWMQTALVIAPPEAYAGETREITARVTEYPAVNDGYTTVYAQLITEDMPRCKAMFYSYDGAADDLQPGDIITAEVKLRSAMLRMGEESDAYLSKGIYLRGYFRGTIVCEDRWWGSFLYFPKMAARQIQETYERLFPARTAMFLKALTTGEKSDIYLDPEIYVSLSVSGIMHVIAVSGMHVMMLVSMTGTLFGNRRGIFLSIGAIVFFSIMTGGSPSVTRAALMYIVVLLAPFLKREPDSITTLSAVLFALLLWNPCAAGSISLQLSFSSMAGLLLVTPNVYAWIRERIKSREGLAGHLAEFVGASLSSTIGASVFSTPVAAWHFGYVSLYSAVTNLLILWLVPICFIGGLLGAVAGVIWMPLGRVIGSLLSIPVEMIYFAAGKISKLPYAAVYLSDNYVGVWLVFVYILFGVLYVCKGRKPFRPLLPVCISLFTLCVLMGTLTYAYRRGTTITAVDVGQGESIVFMDGGTTMVVDCGGDLSGTAGDKTAAYLLGRGRREIDLLVLTHLHEDHVNGVTRLMARVPVQRLILGQGTDNSQAEELLAYAEKYGTEVELLAESTEMTLGNLDITLYSSPDKGEKEGIVVLASAGEYDTLVLGDVSTAAENRLLREYGLPDGELIVAGHHGAKTSTGEALLDAFTPETAWISVGYNSYGHPAEEVLERLACRNIQTRRTDQDGNLEIRIERHGEKRNP